MRGKSGDKIRLQHIVGILYDTLKRTPNFINLYVHK